MTAGMRDLLDAEPEIYFVHVKCYSSSRYCPSAYFIPAPAVFADARRNMVNFYWPAAKLSTAAGLRDEMTEVATHPNRRKGLIIVVITVASCQVASP